MNWYNKYRPNDFDQVLGQDLVKSVLENSLKQNKIKHGYLFNGPKGIGKTTLARIFAAKLNHLDTNPEAAIDIIELDAASNTGIDNIRQLIDSSKTPPINGNHKIYIIDEVHMLSKSAMNALLKTLEEPPEYLVFLLATTNPEKLLPTVLSRLTKLNLNAHTKVDLTQNLQRISQAEKIQIDNESLDLIAKRATGSQRDAINLLETIASYDFENVTISQTAQILGILPETILEKTLSALTDNTLNTDLINEIENLGFDGDTFLGQFLEYLIDTGFNNDNQFSSLIPLVAETISLKLPLTSPLTSLAIVQAKFLPSDLELKKKPVEKKSATTKITAEKNEFIDEKSPKKEEKIVEQEEIITIIETEKNNLEIAPTPEILPELSTEKLSKIIKNSSKQDQAPSILKMLLPHVDVAEFSQSKLVLCTSNSIFLSQLNNPKILTFFKDLIKNETGLNLQISAVLSNKKSQEPEIINYSESGNDEEFIPNPIETTNNSISLNSDVIKKESMVIENPKTEGKIFYQIYKNLPPNVDPDKVKVYSGDLHPPQTEAEDDWDDHAQNMFEFE